MLLYINLGWLVTILTSWCMPGSKVSSMENRSIHWTQQYAVLNRVQETSLDTKHPRKSLKEVQLIDLLPNQSVQGRLKQRWAVLVSRIVCRYLPAFQHQRDVVIWHIPHRYSKEMSSKSQTVSKIGQSHNHIYLLHSCGDIKLSTIFVESSIKTGFFILILSLIIYYYYCI